MDKIICYIDSMALTQRAVTPDGVEHNVPSEVFAESMVGMCMQYNTYNLHLLGNKFFIEGVSEEIEAEEIKRYSSKKIQIEVN